MSGSTFCLSGVMQYVVSHYSVCQLMVVLCQDPQQYSSKDGKEDNSFPMNMNVNGVVPLFVFSLVLTCQGSCQDIWVRSELSSDHLLSISVEVQCLVVPFLWRILAILLYCEHFCSHAVVIYRLIICLWNVTFVLEMPEPVCLVHSIIPCSQCSLLLPILLILIFCDGHVSAISFTTVQHKIPKTTFSHTQVF